MVRKIEAEMCLAINAGKNWQSGNTRVECGPGYASVYLHGHLIATRMNGAWRFNLQGWNTQTTRSRLNAIGASVCTRKGQAFAAGRAVADNEWFTVC